MLKTPLAPITLAVLLYTPYAAADDPLPGLSLTQQSATLTNLDFNVGKAFSVKAENITIMYSQTDNGEDMWSIYGSGSLEVDNKSTKDESDDSDQSDDSGDDANDDDSDEDDDDNSDDSDDNDDTSDDDDSNACENDDGSSNMAEDSDGDGLKEIDADFGDEDEPGIVITGDKVTGLNIGLDGSFELGKLVVCVPDSDPITVQLTQDDNNNNEYELSGELVVKELWQASVTLGTSDQPGIIIDDGSFQLDDLEIDVQDVNVGGLTMKDIKVSYMTEQDKSFNFDVALDIAFPISGFEVAGELDFTDGELSSIGIDYSTSGDEQGIELGDSGIEIAELGAEISNIDQPSDFTFTGTIGLEFGGQIEVDEQELTIIRSNGKVTLNHHSLMLTDMVFVGAFEENDEWKSVLGKGDAEINLDWSEKIYSISGSVDVPNDPGVSVSADLLMAKGDIFFNGKAKVEIPKSIPIIGGWVLEEIDAALETIKGNKDESFAAGWTKVLFATAGAEYNFGTKEFKFIGGKAVGEIKQEIAQNEQNALRTDITKKFDIPDGVESMLLKLTFTEPNVQLAVLADSTLLLLNAADDGPTVFLGLKEVSNADGKVNVAESSQSIAGGFANELTVVGDFPIELTYQVTVLPEFESLGIKKGTGEFVFSYITEFAPNLQMDVEVSLHYPEPAIKASASNEANTEPGTQNVEYFQSNIKLAQQGEQDIQLDFWTHPTLTGNAVVHLFIDDDNEGYDGRAVARNLDYGEHIEDIGGSLIVNWNGLTFQPNLNHPYYFYAVLEDGTNVPQRSEYSEAILRTPPIFGQIIDPLQNNKPVQRARVYLDLNDNKRYDHGEEPVEITNADGKYAFHEVPDNATNLGIILNSAYRFDTVNSPSEEVVQLSFDGSPLQLDFAASFLSSVSGILYTDENSNFSIDDNDKPIENAIVYLDNNANAIRDHDEQTVKTNAQGFYRFNNLDVGRVYRLRADVENAPVSKVVVPSSEFEQFENVDLAVSSANEIIPAPIKPLPPTLERSSSGGIINLYAILILTLIVFFRESRRIKAIY